MTKRRPDDGPCQGSEPGPGPGFDPDPDWIPAPPEATRPWAKHRGSPGGWAARFADRAAAAAGDLLALAVPVECVCCGAEDRTLCAACAARLRQLTRRPFRAEARAPALVDMDGSILLPVVAAGVYRGELAQTLLSFKKHGQRHLAAALARPLAKAIAASAAGAPGLLLVPVPTSGPAFRRRGFSPVHLLLARARRGPGLDGAVVADVLGKAWPGGSGALRLRGPARSGPAPASPGRKGLGRHEPGLKGLGPEPGRKGLRRREPGQKGLGRAARARRVRGSMRIKGVLRPPELQGRACIIVDDVLTTGATLAEAARVLGDAGAVVCGAVVLAATRPPVGGSLAPAMPGPAPGTHEIENK